MDEDTIQLQQDCIREERRLWETALGNVRCILPDDAEDVKREVAQLRDSSQSPNVEY